MFIFGGMQPHQVYPFRSVDGEGERRSVSFNIEYATKDQVEANHMIGQGGNIK